MTNDLSYKINPRPVAELKQKFGALSPRKLQPAAVLNDFITLSAALHSFVASTQITPDEVTGTAVIGLTFRFPNVNYALVDNGDSNLVSVTPTVIT